jgi:hypothetical protein
MSFDVTILTEFVDNTEHNNFIVNVVYVFLNVICSQYPVARHDGIADSHSIF